MSGTPVIVSRIQNRRGTQAQFDALPAPKLLPGEIAICIDSHRLFIGNPDTPTTFYDEIPLTVSNGLNSLVFIPLLNVLPPTGSTYAVIPALTFNATDFFTINYSVTDNLAGSNPNNTGTNFSRNGQLSITSLTATNLSNVPPIPGPTLVDDAVDINSTPYDINFIVQYDSTAQHIQVLYAHNFTTSLLLSTATIFWAGLV